MHVLNCTRSIAHSVNMVARNTSPGLQTSETEDVTTSYLGEQKCMHRIHFEVSPRGIQEHDTHAGRRDCVSQEKHLSAGQT